jgi:hypothetical protein
MVSGEAATSSSLVKWIGDRLGFISSGQRIASNIFDILFWKKWPSIIGGQGSNRSETFLGN